MWLLRWCVSGVESCDSDCQLELNLLVCGCLLVMWKLFFLKNCWVIGQIFVGGCWVMIQWLLLLCCRLQLLMLLVLVSGCGCGILYLFFFLWVVVMFSGIGSSGLSGLLCIFLGNCMGGVLWVLRQLLLWLWKQFFGFYSQLQLEVLLIIRVRVVSLVSCFIVWSFLIKLICWFGVWFDVVVCGNVG